MDLNNLSKEFGLKFLELHQVDKTKFILKDEKNSYFILSSTIKDKDSLEKFNSLLKALSAIDNSLVSLPVLIKNRKKQSVVKIDESRLYISAYSFCSKQQEFSKIISERKYRMLGKILELLHTKSEIFFSSFIRGSKSNLAIYELENNLVDLKKFLLSKKAINELEDRFNIEIDANFIDLMENHIREFLSKIKSSKDMVWMVKGDNLTLYKDVRKDLVCLTPDMDIYFCHRVVNLGKIVSDFFISDTTRSVSDIKNFFIDEGYRVNFKEVEYLIYIDSLIDFFLLNQLKDFLLNKLVLSAYQQERLISVLTKRNLIQWLNTLL